MATTQKVATIKAAMSKKLESIGSLSDGDVESLKDMLQQLDQMEITLDVLTKTLIGTVVSKFKHHDDLGPTAKTLVKKWKQVAKGGGVATATSASSAAKSSDSKPAAAATGEKAERRSSVNSAITEMQEEWHSLQPYRNTTCQKLLDVLNVAKQSLVKDGINADAVDHLVVERATEVEGAMHKKFPAHFKSDYLAKARSLCFNIKKNIPLASRIILGQIQAEKLVSMSSEDLAPDEIKKEKQDRTKKVMESKQLDWASQNEDKINEMCGIKGELLQASLFTWCVHQMNQMNSWIMLHHLVHVSDILSISRSGRCQSTKTTSTQKQTRSADEPMTVFVCKFSLLRTALFGNT
jgi:transcription elongation factor S-II